MESRGGRMRGGGWRHVPPLAFFFGGAGAPPGSSESLLPSAMPCDCARACAGGSGASPLAGWPGGGAMRTAASAPKQRAAAPRAMNIAGGEGMGLWRHEHERPHLCRCTADTPNEHHGRPVQGPRGGAGRRTCVFSAVRLLCLLSTSFDNSSTFRVVKRDAPASGAWRAEG